MNKLTCFRNNLNKNTTEMASIIGVSKSYYEKIEYEDRNPSFNFITKFKKAFPYADVDNIFFSNQSHPACESETDKATGTCG